MREVRILPERDDVYPGTADELSQTPLSLAAHERIVNLPLRETDFAPRYTAISQPTELSATKPSELSGPPFKRTRRS